MTVCKNDRWLFQLSIAWCVESQLPILQALIGIHTLTDTKKSNINAVPHAKWLLEKVGAGIDVNQYSC
jgi:hypothetical protein